MSTMDNEVEKSLTLVTYNLDRKSSYLEERFDAFVEQMKLMCSQSLPPDFIIIQEGTRNLYSRLFLVMKNMGYRRHFFPEVQKRAWGEVIFTRHFISKTEYFRYQHTTQERGLSIYHVEIHGQKLNIATTQLEEGSKRVPYLRKQIAQIEKRFSKSQEPVILAGDFQIANYQADIKEPEGWIDAWVEAGRSNEEYTVDGKINTLAEVQDRPDRIWFLPLDVLECGDCRLVGLPTPRQEMLFASKHFGVWARFLIFSTEE